MSWTRAALVLTVAAACAAAPLCARAAPQAGVAAAVRGQVRLLRDASIGIDVASGEKIFLGDRITTGSDAGLQVLLLDETVFTLGPKSSMVIDKFIYDPATRDGELDAELISGAFRLISGRIAKRDPDRVRVRLPAGTIGIRGTIVDSTVDPDTGRALVVLAGPAVDNTAGAKFGSITIENAGVARDVVRTGWGVEIPDRGSPPSAPFLVPDALLQAVTLDAQPATEPGGASGGSQPGSAPAGGAGSAERGGPGDRSARDGDGSGSSRPADREREAGRGDGAPSSRASATTPAPRAGDRALPPPPDGSAPLPTPQEGRLDTATLAGEPLVAGAVGSSLEAALRRQILTVGGVTRDSAQSTLADPTMLQMLDTATTVMNLVDFSAAFDGHFFYSLPGVPLEGGTGMFDLVIDLDFGPNVVAAQVLRFVSGPLGTSSAAMGAGSVPFGTGAVVNGVPIGDFRIPFAVLDQGPGCQGACPADLFVRLDDTTSQLAGRLSARLIVRNPAGTIVERSLAASAPISSITPPMPK